MLRSMTGFGAGTAETAEYRVLVEVKSVNQRFLDAEIRMPRVLDAFAESMKRKIKEYASRGKLTVSVQFTDQRVLPQTIKVDMNLATAYFGALRDIGENLQMATPTTVAEIAAYPGVLQTVETQTDMTGAEDVLLQALDDAMQRFVAMRENEGAALKADFLQRLTKVETYVEEIATFAPAIVEAYRERLKKTVADYLGEANFDETRIIQEVALYADKVNYTEEIVRLRSHCKQFRAIINDPKEPIGRKLDFLIQELNREINTTASKANDTRAVQIAVEVKSEIEKLREQVQNVE